MRVRGFTLTELLIVIVIIAILAAIIYPVFASVRESNRQATSISNLHDISAKLAQYELDNHQAPPVLFGYPYGGFSMETVLANTPSNVLTTQFPGLYPTYINSVSEFTDPNNPVDSSDSSASAVTDSTGANAVEVNSLGGNATLTSGIQQFYKADAYDVSPQITGQNSLSTVQYVARYQSAWTEVTPGGTPPPSNTWSVFPATDSPQAIYQRQLHWQFPPANTYVTSTTYHVSKSNIVLVLYNDGSVVKLTSEQFMNRDGGSDPASVAVNATTQTSSANFWQVLPSGK